MSTPEQLPEVDHGARQHHKHSPSKLDNKEACPFFQQDDTESEASKRGTAQHEAMDTDIDDHLSDEEVRAVEKCRTYYADLRKQYGAKLVELNERRVAVDDEETTAGYYDKTFIIPTEINVNDTKFGKWSVRDAETNLQGISYRLGVYRELLRDPDLVRRCQFAFSDPDWTPARIKALRVTFLLPYRDEVDTHVMSVDDIPKHLLRIRTVVARAENPQPGDENPNTVTCFFCNQKAKCKALHRMILKIGDKYEPLQIPYPVEPMLVSEATPEQLAVGLKFASIVAGWAAAWRQQATARAQMEEGVLIPGFQVVISERREIVDIKKFATTVLDATGIELIDLVEQAGDFFLTKTEKLVSSRAPRGKKGEYVEMLSTKLEESGAVVRKPPSFALKQKSTES